MTRNLFAGFAIALAGGAACALAPPAAIAAGRNSVPQVPVENWAVEDLGKLKLAAKSWSDSASEPSSDVMIGRVQCSNARPSMSSLRSDQAAPPVVLDRALLSWKGRTHWTYVMLAGEPSRLIGPGGRIQETWWTGQEWIEYQPYDRAARIFPTLRTAEHPVGSLFFASMGNPSPFGRFPLEAYFTQDALFRAHDNGSSRELGFRLGSGAGSITVSYPTGLPTQPSSIVIEYRRSTEAPPFLVNAFLLEDWRPVGTTSVPWKGSELQWSEAFNSAASSEGVASRFEFTRMDACAPPEETPIPRLPRGTYIRDERIAAGYRLGEPGVKILGVDVELTSVVRDPIAFPVALLDLMDAAKLLTGTSAPAGAAVGVPLGTDKVSATETPTDSSPQPASGGRDLNETIVGERSAFLGEHPFKGSSYKLQHTFLLTNKGSKPIRIAATKSSCGCTSARCTTNQIEVGEQFPVEVELEIRSSGAKYERVWLVFEGGAPPMQLNIRCFARSEWEQAMWPLQANAPESLTTLHTITLAPPGTAIECDACAYVVSGQDGKSRVFRLTTALVRSVELPSAEAARLGRSLTWSEFKIVGREEVETVGRGHVVVIGGNGWE